MKNNDLTKVVILAVHVNHIVLVHVELMLGIHFTQLSTNPFSGNNSSGPGLEPNDYSYILLKVILHPRFKQNYLLTI